MYPNVKNKFPNSTINADRKRSDAVNQQPGSAYRPQEPQDATGGMKRWTPGQLPVGGFRSVIDFSEPTPYTTKKSPTSGGGKKVY